VGGGLILVAVAGLAGGSMAGGGLLDCWPFVGFVGRGWRVFTRARSSPSRRPEWAGIEGRAAASRGHACPDPCNTARAEAVGGGLILVAVAGLAGGSMAGGGLLDYWPFVGSVGFVGWGWRVFTWARSSPSRRPEWAGIEGRAAASRGHACLDPCNTARAEAVGGGLILVAVAGLAGGSMAGGGLLDYRPFVGAYIRILY